MKLYSSPISPYASRCRIQIRHKNLPVEIVPPPGGMGSEQVKARNPMGKIPVLELGEDSLAESWAIMEYLEARFPEIPMRPADPLATAHQQELVRFADLYLAPAMFPLFLALRGAADAEAVSKALDGLQGQLQILEQLLARGGRSEELDLADAALLPIVWYAQILARHFGLGDCLASLTATRSWWQQASQIPAAAQVLAEMDASLRAAMPALFADH